MASVSDHETKGSSNLSATKVILSKDVKKERNRLSQQKHRLQKTTWDSFPAVFQSIFESSLNAVSKIRKASFFEREGRTDRISWSTGSPRLIPIQECVDGDVLTSDMLWEEILDNVAHRQRIKVVKQGADMLQTVEFISWDRVIRDLLKQIGRPAEALSDLSAIFELPLPSGKAQLSLPARFGRTIINTEATKVHSANIAFVNHTVNFHVDMGYAGLSAITGDCEKIWLLAPPRDKNIELIVREGQSIVTLVEGLDDLAIIRQSPGDVMFLPPGVIHATFTVKTGILYGCNFTTRENIFGATMGLLYILSEHELDDKDSWNERSCIIQSWISAIRQIVERADVKEMAEAEYALCHRGVKRARRNGALRNLAADVQQLARQHFPAAVLKERPVKKRKRIAEE